MTAIQTSSIRTILVALIAILICVPAVLHASPYSDAVNALNPDAYYRGDEGSGAPQDTTANGHHMDNYFTNTYAGGPTAGDGLPGMDAANGAYQFTGPQVARSGEGATQYLPALGQDPRTVIAWVNLDTDRATLGGAHNIWQWGLDFGGANTFTAWSLFIETGWDPGTNAATGFDAATLNIQGRQIQALDTPINVGDWHMIAIGFEGDGTAPLGDAMIWIDGALQTNIVQDTVAVPNTGGTNGPALGFRLGQAVGGFGANARVDHVSVHTEKLSGVAIQGLWDAANIPEPASCALLGIAALLLGSMRRRA